LVNGRADGGLVALYIDERVPHVGNDNRQSIATMGGFFRPHVENATFASFYDAYATAYDGV